VLVDELVVDVLVVEEVVVIVLVVDVSVVFETKTSACLVVGASESITEVAALVIGATTFDVGAASSGVVCSVTTSAGGTAMVFLGSGAAAVEVMVGRGRDGGSVSALLRATVWSLVAVRVALMVNRLDTAKQRCPPQHRMIRLRLICSAGHHCY
jgi:hypothetical protein